MEHRFSYTFLVGTNICIGTLFFTKGSIREGMTYHIEDGYALIYPNPKYVTEFLGTVNVSRFEEPKRICESIAPLPKRLDEQGSKIAELAGPLIKAEDWILAIIASLWDEDILEPALETAKLLESDQGYVDGFS